MKQVVLRVVAERDIDNIIESYHASNTKAAAGFVTAIEAVFSRMTRFPESGSPRYSHELNIPGLRHAPVGKYPYLVFYREQAVTVDVWRVLHVRRDVPALIG